MTQIEFLCECCVCVHLKFHMHYKMLMSSSVIQWLTLQILPLLLSSCVNLGKLLNILHLSSLNYKLKKNSSNLSRLLGGLNEIIHVNITVPGTLSV